MRALPPVKGSPPSRSMACLPAGQWLASQPVKGSPSSRSTACLPAGQRSASPPVREVPTRQGVTLTPARPPHSFSRLPAPRPRACAAPGLARRVGGVGQAGAGERPQPPAVAHAGEQRDGAHQRGGAQDRRVAGGGCGAEARPPALARAPLSQGVGYGFCRRLTHPPGPARPNPANPNPVRHAGRAGWTPQTQRRRANRRHHPPAVAAPPCTVNCLCRLLPMFCAVLCKFARDPRARAVEAAGACGGAPAVCRQLPAASVRCQTLSGVPVPVSPVHTRLHTAGYPEGHPN